MTRVLGLAGSPRRRGNTETLLDTFLEGAAAAGAEVEKVAVAELQIEPCVECDSCWQDGRCVTEDGYQELCEKLVAADVIAVASPVYFWSVPAQLKVVIDRSQCQWVRKQVLGASLPPTDEGRHRRRGVFLSVGGQPNQDFGCIIKTVSSFFELYEADNWGQVVHEKVDAKGEVEDLPGTLRAGFEMGQRAVTEEWRT